MGNVDKGIDDDKAEEELGKRARNVSEEDVRRIAEGDERIQSKLNKVPGQFVKLVNQVKLLAEMVRDYWKGVYRKVPWATIAVAVAALVYFLSPVDAIPDFIPVVGYLDDATVVALAVRILQGDLREYCGFKGRDPAQYFE